VRVLEELQKQQGTLCPLLSMFFHDVYSVFAITPLKKTPIARGLTILPGEHNDFFILSLFTILSKGKAMTTYTSLVEIGRQSQTLPIW
jgi:hypothetical protein